MVREGLLPHARRRHGCDPEGGHQGVPQARPRSAPRQEPRRRSSPRRSSRSSRPPTTCSATRPSARSTTRSERWARRRWADAADLADLAASPSTSRTWVTRAVSATCSARCSDAVVKAVAVRAGASGVGPRRGTDITAQLTVDFKDAVHGITTTLYLTTDAQCATCQRNGREARYVAGDVLGMRRSGRRRRQPGHVLVLVAVSRLRRPGQPDRRSVPDVSRQRCRATPA